MFSRGTTIAGFTLVRRLGAGGMGEIWEAVRREGDFELRAALKVANPDVLAMPEGRNLFQREASLAASLRHPNIASVLSADLERGLIFYELVSGADLRQLLGDGTGTRLPMPVVVSLLYQICRGLSHAHRREVQGKKSPVVHRDMSPGNVVIDYDGNLKIVDFGIAKAIATGERSESIKGKISYMAPEQATAGDMDGRTDQYAVGVIAYEAIAGVRPNDGAHEGETLHNILQGNHRPLQEVAPQVPAGLATLVERMLALRPEDRFPTMDAVIDALEPFHPKLSVHREVAALVKKARPRQTIVYKGDQIDSIPVAEAESQGGASTQPGYGNARPGPAIHSPSAPGAAEVSPMAATQIASDSLPPPAAPRPRLNTPSAASDQPVAPQLQSLPTAPAPQGRAAVFASTGAIIAAGLVIAALWLTRNKPLETQATSPDPIAPAPAPLAAPSVTAATQASQDVPAAAVPAKPAAHPPETETEPSKRLASTRMTAKERAHEMPPAPPPPPAPSPTDEGPAAVEEPAAVEKGHLQVGVFPPTNVWIDGRKRGRSPLTVELRVGKHMVGAGEREPVVRKQVSVRANETEKIFLELGN